MDATFWAFIGLVLFLAILAYMKVPGMIGRSLDERAQRIRNELEQARLLREESQELLDQYRKKREEAEKEAGEIVAAAQREAEGILADARQKSQDYVARRTTLAEQKIAQAERDAVSEVRSRAVDLAVEAATRILADKVDAGVDAELFKSSLQEVKARMN